ncbi:hypothetical protein HZ326_3655 [Fusarium oxysporum f. sp. albedinis]|nr:hypothetical protein HZ326_3655 [Fusarium oxysporum f. sp. albedinis]
MLYNVRLPAMLRLRDMQGASSLTDKRSQQTPISQDSKTITTAYVESSQVLNGILNGVIKERTPQRHLTNVMSG